MKEQIGQNEGAQTIGGLMTGAVATPGAGAHHGLATPLLEPLEQRTALTVRADDDLVRDPEYIRELLPAVERFAGLFDPEVRGFERIPARGPLMLVGNHSGVYWFPDTWIFTTMWFRRRGIEEPIYALIYDLLFAVPRVSGFLRRFGCLPASPAHGRAALDVGATVLVYPGGDWEACRPWTLRNRVDFGGHHGFVRLALETGVPLVPVVSHGSHCVVVLSRGDRIARLLGLDRLHIHVFPLIVSIPFGPATILTPTLPLPAQVTLEILEPITWPDLDADAARDGVVVDRCAGEVMERMQAALDRLSTERARPVLRRLRDVMPSPPGFARPGARR